MFRFGQTATQLPQPLQCVSSITGIARPASSNLKRIAPAAHASPQLRQVIPCVLKQTSPIDALRPHGVSNARLSAPYLQACSQAPQNVQLPYWKFTVGNPPSPTTRTRSSQALMQSSQRRQASTKFPTDQGGRSEPGPVSRLPRRNARRDKLILFMVVAPKAIKARPQRSLHTAHTGQIDAGSLRHGRKHGGGVRRHMRGES